MADGLPGVTAPAFLQGRASLFEAVVDKRERFVHIEPRDVVEEIDRTVIIIEVAKDGHRKVQYPKVLNVICLYRGKRMLRMCLAEKSS